MRINLGVEVDYYFGYWQSENSYKYNKRKIYIIFSAITHFNGFTLDHDENVTLVRLLNNQEIIVAMPYEEFLELYTKKT